MGIYAVMAMPSFHLMITIIFFGLVTGNNLYDPYEILGVSRSASSAEIRRSYIHLVKEWHPDKSSDPSAQERFVIIKQAYELLSDVERRKRYDEKGIIEEDTSTRYKSSNHFENTFRDIFEQNVYFQEADLSFFYKILITSRQYEQYIIPKSQTTPYILFFFQDNCFRCIHSVPRNRKLIEYLEPLGIIFAALNVDREPELTRKLNAHSPPCLGLLLDGKWYVYKDTISNVQKIVEFIRSKLPYNLVPTLTDDNIDDFLNGWEDNRVRILIFETGPNIRLRYLITAFHFRNRVALGHVESIAVRKRYQVSSDMDTVLLFHENITKPVASLSMQYIPTYTLHHIIHANQYLSLPRLSSQELLNSLCPIEFNNEQKKLCVVLVIKTNCLNNPYCESFRSYAQHAPFSKEKVQFAYIYYEKQINFLTALMPDGMTIEPLLNIVILWRRDGTHVKYEWLNQKWVIGQQQLNKVKKSLELTIGHLLRSTKVMTYESIAVDLFNEHERSLVAKIIARIASNIRYLYINMDSSQFLPALSVLGTVAFIVLFAYIMLYLVKLEEKNINIEDKERILKNKQNRQLNNSNGINNVSSAISYQPELRLHEFRAEKYNGLLRLLKPGCRTILLIVDSKSWHQLIPPFHKAVWIYRKNKTLMFAYMYIEKGLNWFRELLELSITCDRQLKINPRNCVGTVLSLNGHRKYFCMFHAKHTEVSPTKRKNGTTSTSNGKTNRMHNMLLHQQSIKHKDCELGESFIRFQSDSSQSDDDNNENEVLLQENLLDDLPNWLDKLFEGTTQRYHINYWPDFNYK